MLRTQFEEELLNLHNQFYEMGMMVSSAVHKSVKAYINHDKKLAQEVIDRDIEINDMEVKLEKKSFEMIALQQPVTTDLRMIITVMKASSDLKKMVDNVLIAYVKTDQKDARMIAQMDDRTNEYFDSIYKHAVEAMKANPETVISGTDYLHVAQYLERIGDYVTNICEWIVYLATGKITELNSNRDEQF